MKLYIDGEWNSFGGELISMALVDEEGFNFYEVLGYDNPDPWVAEHVIPILDKEPISKIEFQIRLQDFLNQYESIHIIADWPEDLMWFCKMLITGPGIRLATPPLSMEVLRVDSVSLRPHNALSDAFGLRDHLQSS